MEAIIYGVAGAVLAAIVIGAVWLRKRTNHNAVQHNAEPKNLDENQLLSGIYLDGPSRFSPKPARLRLVASNAAISKPEPANHSSQVISVAKGTKSRPPVKRKNGAEVIKLVYSKNDDVAQSAKK